MEKCLLYLFSIGSQFPDSIHWMVFDLFFYCVTVETIYMHARIRVLGWRILRVYFGSDISELHCIYTMKFPWNLEGWFSGAMKSLQKHWKWFSWAIKFLSISGWQNSWPMKIQCQPNMNFMGNENSNWPRNSHESISGSFLQYRFIKRKNHKNAKLTLE